MALFQLLLKNVWSQRNILHSYLTNTPQVARQNDSRLYTTELKYCAIFWQIWSLDPTRPVKLYKFRDPTKPDPTQFPTTGQPNPCPALLSHQKVDSRINQNYIVENWPRWRIELRPLPSSTSDLDILTLTLWAIWWWPTHMQKMKVKGKSIQKINGRKRRFITTSMVPHSGHSQLYGTANSATETQNSPFRK